MQRAAVGLQLGGPLLKRLEHKVALLVAVPVGMAQVAVSRVGVARQVSMWGMGLDHRCITQSQVLESTALLA